MWELNHKESWVMKNWCFWTVVLEKTLENPLDCKEIKPVNPKGNQSWIFIGRMDAEAETPILWPPNVKDWLSGKDPDVGKDWRQEEKGTTEDEMVGWHHWLNGHEFEQAPRVGDTGRPGVLQSTGSQRVGHDWTTELNWIEAYCLPLQTFLLSHFHEFFCPKKPNFELFSILQLLQVGSVSHVQQQDSFRLDKIHTPRPNFTLLN